MSSGRPSGIEYRRSTLLEGLVERVLSVEDGRHRARVKVQRGGHFGGRLPAGSRVGHGERKRRADGGRHDVTRGRGRALSREHVERESVIGNSRLLERRWRNTGGGISLRTRLNDAPLAAPWGPAASASDASAHDGARKLRPKVGPDCVFSVTDCLQASSVPTAQKPAST